jgi:hypothetical protein
MLVTGRGIFIAAYIYNNLIVGIVSGPLKIASRLSILGNCIGKKFLIFFCRTRRLVNTFVTSIMKHSRIQLHFVYKIHFNNILLYTARYWGLIS